ncbi:hypothetical protein ACV229_31250, partial [Burkholderia sp. MR1-5-21]
VRTPPGPPSLSSVKVNDALCEHRVAARQLAEGLREYIYLKIQLHFTVKMFEKSNKSRPRETR